MKVLIADDNEINRRFLRGVLEPEGVDVVEAEDGEEAVRSAATERFDLVLMDIRMPGMDGFEATRAIRSAADFDAQRTRIVALTADLRLSQKEELMSIGFSDCLAKPVDRTTVLALVAGADHTTDSSETHVDSDLIDWEAALASAGGNRELVSRLGDMLRSELERFLPELERDIGEGRHVEARERVHKVRGSSAYCGARVLQRRAEGLETALSDGGDVDAAWQAFRRTAADTMRALDDGQNA